MGALSRRSLACRLAERWRIDEPGSRGRLAKGRFSLRARWAQYHTERCTHCRAEAAEWAPVERLLRRADIPAAPPELYESVMARIGESPRQRAGIGSGGRVARRNSLGVGFSLSGLPGAASTAFVGCLIAIGVAYFEFIPLRYVVDSVWSWFVLWWDYALSVIAFVRAGWSDAWAALAVMVSAVPPGVQPYLSAVLWSGVGSLISAALMRGPRWLRLWFSDPV